jgi:hypothetical protein
MAVPEQATNPLPRIKLFAGAGVKPNKVTPTPDQENLYTDVSINGVPFVPGQEGPEQPLRLTLQSRAGPGKRSPEKKVKKPRQLKSQARGMPLDDVKACRNCLKKILNEKAAEMFRYPVGRCLVGISVELSHTCCRSGSRQRARLLGRGTASDGPDDRAGVPRERAVCVPRRVPRGHQADRHQRTSV